MTARDFLGGGHLGRMGVAGGARVACVAGQSHATSSEVGCVERSEELRAQSVRKSDQSNPGSNNTHPTAEHTARLSQHEAKPAMLICSG